MRNRITSHLVHKLTIATLLGGFALGTLAACGVKGDLKTPPPIWGDKSKAEKQDSEKSKPQSDN